MKRFLIRFEAALLLASIILTTSACNSGNAPAGNTAANTAPANVPAAGDNNPANAPATARFSEDELDELFARIALYPDPLLAQIIPASTFVDQLKEAQGTLNGSADDGRIENQNWDVSVKSVAHYPDVLKMMAGDEGWTTSVGTAYVTQPEDVGKSIQRLRDQAYEIGNLQTTPQQNVIESGDVIRIEPAQAKTIYVPQYDSQTVYVEQPQDDGVSTGTAVAAAAIAFGAGLLIGSWLNNDYDYYGRGVYYHGWATGPAWVNVNRAYVNVNHGVYVNHNYANINVNRNVVTHHSATTYRRNLTLNSSMRRGRVDNARINNPGRVNNDLPRANNPSGRNRVNNDLPHANNPGGRNRVNNELPHANPGARNPGGSPRINTNDRNLGGARSNPAPKVQNRQAPAPRPQRQAAPNPGGGGRRSRP